MPIGSVGTTAWALLITVADPVQSSVPYAEPSLHMEQETQCRSIADAINGKAQQAGVASKISARCTQIEYVEIPEELKNR
uniref:Uncharacterized protein n=1 Tax=viral metagenome TaxID=1070528 RepID=A0A6H1Z6W4_9ZZZZ